MEFHSSLKAPDGPYSTVLIVSQICLENGRHIIVRAARQNTQAKHSTTDVVVAREAARQERVVANGGTVSHEEAHAAAPNVAPPVAAAKTKKRNANRYVLACSSYCSQYCAINVLNNDLYCWRFLV